MSSLSWRNIAATAEARNILWMVADRLWRMAISLVVGVWVIRYLGPDDFGQINYVLAFIGVATVVVNFGMESFLIKELVSAPERKQEIISTAINLRLKVAGLVFAGLLLLLFIMREQQAVFILFFLLVPQMFSAAFNVVDIALQSELRSRITVIVRNSFFVLGAALKLLAILTHQGIYVFALLTVLDMVLADLFLFFYYRKRTARSGVGFTGRSYIGELAKKSLPFLVSNIAIVIYMKVDQILLGKLAEIKQVGYFSAATKVAEVFYFIPLAITGSLFGKLVQARKESPVKYQDYSRKIFFPLVALAVVASGIVYMFSAPIISFLFGDAYAASTAVLQLYIWSVVFVFAGVAFNQLLVIEDQNRAILYKTLTGVVLNLVLNVLLIPKYGAMGAAFATVVTQFVSSVLANFFFAEARRLFLGYFRSGGIRGRVK